jgi:hypothetical protein
VRALSSASRNSFVNFAFLAAGKDIASAKHMFAPTARHLNQLAEEVRAVAAQMRDPDAKQIMARLVLTYDRLAEFAALREASDRPNQVAPFRFATPIW